MKLRGSLVLAPFPYDDFTEAKPRPSLCLSELWGQNFQVVGAYITSQTVRDFQPTDFEIDPASALWKQTGLSKISLVRLHKLASFDASTIRRRMGVWPANEWREMKFVSAFY